MLASLGSPWRSSQMSTWYRWDGRHGTVKSNPRRERANTMVVEACEIWPRDACHGRVWLTSFGGAVVAGTLSRRFVPTAHDAES